MDKFQKKNKILLLILGMVILGTIILIWFIRRSEEVVAPTAEIKIFTPVAVPTEVLRGAAFLELRAFGVYPLRPGRMGRENPFIKPTKEELKQIGEENFER